MIRAAITAVGGYVPDFVMTNDELAKFVDTNDEWITSRTGIKERRVLNIPGKATSDMMVFAVEELLQKRGIGADEIDLLIFSIAVTGSRLRPSVMATADLMALVKSAAGAPCPVASAIQNENESSFS